MKTTFKFLFALTAIFSLITACSSDDSPTEPEIPAEVGINSFGFYAEDNSGVLFDDYVVESITGTDISIALPSETNLTALVARFTTTENDIVKIGAVEQVSGTTANDFSAAVEYLVTENNTNKIYTVTISKMASAVWSPYSTYAEDTIDDISLQINPITSVPYIAYVSDRDSSSDQKMNLINFDGTVWNRIGGTDFSTYRANSVDLKFSPSGTPYISFLEYTDIREASVMSYENSSWNYVGGSAYTGVKSAANTVAVTSDNTVYGFYVNDVSGSDDRRSVFSKVYSGAAWSDLTITGRSGYARALKSKVVNDEVYLAVLDYGEGQAVSVYKYDGTTWTTLANKMKESEDNTVYYYNIAMDVDQEGNVYLAYAENNGEDTDYQLRVKKYDAEAASWSTLGDLIVTTNTRDFDLAVSKYNEAMLLYQNDTKTPVFVAFDTDINNWGTPVVFSDADAESLKIEVAPNGIAYAAYLANDQLSLHKFDSPDNQ